MVFHFHFHPNLRFGCILGFWRNRRWWHTHQTIYHRTIPYALSNRYQTKVTPHKMRRYSLFHNHRSELPPPPPYCNSTTADSTIATSCPGWLLHVVVSFVVPLSVVVFWHAYVRSDPYLCRSTHSPSGIRCHRCWWRPPRPSVVTMG